VGFEISGAELYLTILSVGLTLMSFFFLFKSLEKGFRVKTCPHCKEKIKKAAKVCRYCTRDV
jgi:predicted amidophosphoribosyltransferase